MTVSAVVLVLVLVFVLVLVLVLEDASGIVGPLLLLRLTEK